MSALPAVLMGLAVLAWAPRRPADRLAVVLPRAARPVGRQGPRRPGLGPVGACALAGVALAVLVGGLPGAAGGLLAAVLGPRALRGLEPAAARADRERLAADLPTALDLLAACLAGGAPTSAAVQAVASAVPGPVGDRFGQVALALEVGAPAAQAWERLAAGDPDGLTGSAARALARAAEGGAPVAAAVTRLAEQSRAQARHRGEQAAARAGVLAVAPLGLCFLPAFVLLGVVPVVAGLVGPVLTAL